MRLALPLLSLVLSTPILAFNFHLDIPVLNNLLPRQDSTSRTANTQTSIPTVTGTAGGPDTATARTANTQTSFPSTTGTTPALDNTTTRTANTQVTQPAGTSTSSSSSSSSTSTTPSGTTTSSRTTSAMIAVAAPLRTHDVHLPAACVGLAAVAIGMGML